MQIYELGYLVLPSLPEGELSNIETKLKDIIAKSGGNVFDGEAPFKLDLAYTMSKTVGSNRYVVNNAYIGWLKFEMEPASVSGVEHAIQKLDEILRFIVIKAPRENSFTFADARNKLLEEEKQKEAKDASEEIEVAVE